MQSPASSLSLLTDGELVVNAQRLPPAAPLFVRSATSKLKRRARLDFAQICVFQANLSKIMQNLACVRPRALTLIAPGGAL